MQVVPSQEVEMQQSEDGTDQTCQCAIKGWPRIFPPYQFVAHQELACAAATAAGAGQDILLHTFFRVKVRTKWPGMSSSHPSFAVLCADAFCAVHVMELGIESSASAKVPMPSKFAKLNVK